QTPWVKSKSFVLSDRIPPSHPKPQSASAKNKGKQVDAPKSAEVRRLEKLRDSLKRATGAEKDPKGGCFCTARVHPLSQFTPICHSCGLVLCEVQQPYHACPHCSAALLSPAARGALVEDLERKIVEAIAKEEEDRIRAIRAAQEAAGAFPSLAAASSGSSTLVSAQAHPVNQTHKVVSLNTKTKKVTIASYAPSQPVSRAASRGGSPHGEPTDEPKRVPPPSPEVPFADRTLESLRPWTNLRTGGVTYVPPPKGTGSTSERGSAAKKPKRERDGGDASQAKTKGKENQNQKA
ncbi:hypothetical protein CERSUDRAFT_133252, partial [Gelatoporia subvermispora B]